MNLLKNLSIFSAFSSLLCAAFPVSAITFQDSAIENDFCSTQSQFCSPIVGSFDLSLSTPSPSISNGSFELFAFGDFDRPEESFNVEIEGVNLGTFLDDNTNNDSFDVSIEDGDKGNQFVSVSSGTATIPQTTLNSIISDGELTATFTNTTANINNNDDLELEGGEQNELQNEFIGFELIYEQSELEPQPVPFEAEGAMGLAAIASYLGYRRLNKRKQVLIQNADS